MRTLEEYVVPSNSGRASVVHRGRYIRVAGRTTADFVAFNLINPRERFDQARTKTNQNTIYVTAGHVLYTQLNNVLLTIVEDTYAGGGRQHNLEKGMCSRKRHLLAFQRGLMQASYLRTFTHADLPDHGCWENLSEAVRPWGILPEDIPAPFNIFQTLEIDPVSGRMTNTSTRPRNGAHVTMRAEMDCLAALSACPDITVGGREIHVSILEDAGVTEAADAGRPAR